MCAIVVGYVAEVCDLWHGLVRTVMNPWPSYGGGGGFLDSLRLLMKALQRKLHVAPQKQGKIKNWDKLTTAI
jgi:hypothetical protein